MSALNRIFLAGALLALLILSPRAFAKEEGWETDLDTALAKAQKADKPVLVDFSGSDWCVWCKRLDKEVFSQDAFKKFAAENLILCVLDFPRDKSLVPPEQAKKNIEYRDRYPIEGYPTVFLMDPDGSVFLKTGYRRGGAEAYAEFLQKVLTARAKVKEFLGSDKKPGLKEAKAALDKIPEDAKVLRALLVISTFPEKMIAERAKAAYTLIKVNRDRGGRLLKFLEAVADKDPGEYFKKLKLEKMQTKLMAGVQKMMAAYQASQKEGSKPEAAAKAKAAAEKMLKVTEDAETKVDDKRLRQAALVFRAVAFHILGNQEGVDGAFKKAKEIDPKARILSWGAKTAKPTKG